MRLWVNGQEKETQQGNVSLFLKELGLHPTQVAIELNGVVLFRHDYPSTALKEGDRMEIVKVVAGG